MEEGPISGVSVAVARGPRVVHSQGYGYADIENERHAKPETIYRVGSITKQFTAAAVMQLVDDGRIDLDAPVTEYLPDFAAYSGVTVQQLLNHTVSFNTRSTSAHLRSTRRVRSARPRWICCAGPEPFREG